jgi:hypothetical protein
MLSLIIEETNLTSQLQETLVELPSRSELGWLRLCPWLKWRCLEKSYVCFYLFGFAFEHKIPRFLKSVLTKLMIWGNIYLNWKGFGYELFPKDSPLVGWLSSCILGSWCRPTLSGLFILRHLMSSCAFGGPNIILKMNEVGSKTVSLCDWLTWRMLLLTSLGFYFLLCPMRPLGKVVSKLFWWPRIIYSEPLQLWIPCLHQWAGTWGWSSLSPQATT